MFKSIHGEVNGHHQGRVCTFIRLGGCNLKCSYCDTPKTQKIYSEEYEVMTPQEVVDSAIIFGNNHVCVTGGEPMIASEIYQLLHKLWKNKFKISVETNGTVDLLQYLPYVDSFVVDFKLDYPDNMDMVNYTYLRKTDVIKFVIKNKKQFAEAIYFKERLESEGTKAVIAFSPIIGEYSNEEFAKDVIRYRGDNLVLSLQIHKLLNIS